MSLPTRFPYAVVDNAYTLLDTPFASFGVAILLGCKHLPDGEQIKADLSPAETVASLQFH